MTYFIWFLGWAFTVGYTDCLGTKGRNEIAAMIVLLLLWPMILGDAISKGRKQLPPQ